MTIKDCKLVTKEQIKSDLIRLGINEGDTVFFHSSLKSIGPVDGGANSVINAFLEILGNTGTLALPALCWYDWENMDRESIKNSWDIKNTPTFTGIIPETFRKRPDSMRSDNPTHSVTAVGRFAAEITKDHNKAQGGEWAVDRPIWVSDGAFGMDSPWDKLYILDAKCLLIGVDFHSCTMLHHAQVMLLEKHLKHTGRSAHWPVFDFRLMGSKLEALGLVVTGKIGDATTRVIGCKSLIDMSIHILLKERCTYYR